VDVRKKLLAPPCGGAGSGERMPEKRLLRGVAGEMNMVVEHSDGGGA
jgi:hypothetical protein